jgi:hypothetical protein
MAQTDDEQRADGAQQTEDKNDQEAAREEMRKLEEADEVPSDPGEWPDGKAKFLTYANDSDEPFGEGPTAKLGPGSVEHHEDGSVTINGEEVDDPDAYKGDPIPGGPTDPNAPKLQGEKDRSGDGSGGDAEQDDEES